MSLYRKTASEIAEMIKNKEVTSEEVTKEFLQRIDSLEDKVGAFSSVLKEKSLESAKKYDNDNNENKKKEYDNTLLFGVPVALKDNILSKGDLTTASSQILKNYEGVYDATVVEKLKKAGVPIIGKANMDEFAMGSSNENSSIKPASNPWALDRVPGGSSGGSAAAVAAQMVPIALGSDTGGSIRQPASLTGTVGIKPTYGRVSRYGLMAFGSSLDQIGALAKSTEDLARIMQIISGHDEKDPTTAEVEVPDYLKSLNNDLKGLKVGLPKEYFTESLDKDIKEDFEKALNEVDIILTPVSPTTAFKKGEKNTDPVQMYLADIYTVSINMAGVPAISVPAGFVNGLPVGIQLIGNYFREDLLFNVSHKFEEARGKIEYPEL